MTSRGAVRDERAVFIAGAVVGLVSGAVLLVATFFRWWSGGDDGTYTFHLGTGRSCSVNSVVNYSDCAYHFGRAPIFLSLLFSEISGLVVLLAIAALVVRGRASRKHRKRLGWWIGSLGALLVLAMPALPDAYPLLGINIDHMYVAFAIAKIAAWGIVVAGALVLVSSRKPFDGRVPVHDRYGVFIAGGVVGLAAGLVSFAATSFRWWSNSNGYDATVHDGHGGTCRALVGAKDCIFLDGYRYFDSGAQGFYPAIGILVAMLGIAVLVVNRRASRRGRTWFGCCIGALGVLAAVVTPTIPDHEFSRVQQTHAAFWIANFAAWAAVLAGALLLVSARKAKDRGTNADTFDRAAVE